MTAPLALAKEALMPALTKSLWIGAMLTGISNSFVSTGDLSRAKTYSSWETSGVVEEAMS